jgi:hypothetical protein
MQELRAFRQQRGIGDQHQGTGRWLPGELDSQVGPDTGGFAGGQGNDGDIRFFSHRAHRGHRVVWISKNNGVAVFLPVIDPARLSHGGRNVMQQRRECGSVQKQSCRVNNENHKIIKIPDYCGGIT